MSDMGVSSVYGGTNLDIDATLKKLVDARRAQTITPVETDLKRFQLQRDAWNDLGTRLSSLRTSSSALFSFQNPFNERVVKSSDAAVLTATATREALEETLSIVVKQTAAADRFMSDPIASDFRVPEGSYAFTVGKTTVRLSFAGGTLKEFVEALNRKGGDTVRAQIVQLTSDSRVLVVQSMREGAENRLSFSEAAERLALDTGIVERALSSRQDLAVDKPTRFDLPMDAARVAARDGVLTVGPGSEAALRLPAALASSGLVLELEVEMTERPAVPVDVPPPGPSIPDPGAVEFEGIVIRNAPAEAHIPEWTPPPVPVRNEDPSVLFLIDGSGRSLPLDPLTPGGGFRTIRVPLSAYADTMGGIGIRNLNTDRDVRIRAVRVFDPTETGGFRPRKPIQTAQDAIVSMDGIEVTRSSNAIDDLIPGVTLQLGQASDKPVKLTIEPDREAVKEAIIQFVGNYNLLMAELNILGRADERTIDEFSFTDEERKDYRERLGLFSADSTVSMMRSRLLDILSSAYPTADGAVVLASFGIATRSGFGGGYDASTLRGYLQIDETKLDAALKGSFADVRQAFGFDTNGDLLVDAGAAFQLDAFLKGYVETGGILSTRTSGLDSSITSTKRRLTTLEEQLERYEQEQKELLYKMASAMSGMESSSKTIDSWTNTGD